MVSVFKRGGSGNYIIHYFDANGRRREKSSGTTDKRAAERIAAKLEAEAVLRQEGIIDVRQEHLSNQGRTPIGKHVDDFIQSKRDAGRSPRTITDAKRLTSWLIKATDAHVLDDLTADSISKALRQLTDKGLSARTHNHHLSLATGFLTWCVKRGRLAYNPAQVLTPLDEDRDRRYRRRSLTPEELERLFAVAEERGRKAWYLTAFWAGLRLSELGRLKWKDVDFENGVLTVADGKAHRVDRIPMHADLVEELSRIKDPLAHPTGKVFPTSVTSRTRVLDFGRAGIPLVDDEGRHADLHALRATLGTMLARAGVAPQVAREIMRHSDYRTTLKSYTMLGLSDSRSAVAKLDIKTPAHTPAVGARNGAIGCETVRDGVQPNEKRDVG